METTPYSCTAMACAGPLLADLRLPPNLMTGQIAKTNRATCPYSRHGDVPPLPLGIPGSVMPR